MFYPRENEMNVRTKRILMTVIGVLLCGAGAGMYDFSHFGMDPFMVLSHGIWKHTGLGFGTVNMIVNLVFLVFVFFINRRKIGLGTVLNMLILGYVVEFVSAFFKSCFPDPALWLRALILLAATVVLCFSSSLYFTADLGVSTYDAFALTLAERTPIKFKFCRIGTDLCCVITGFLLGAVVGIGTLVTAFFMGPLISFFNQTISEPFLGIKKEQESE